ncbi:MAG: hypothetical protein IT263_04805 [Saprospiraceae bacterium]|nr:hypothetical protein [Saprospiraceae bacterium]
MKDNIFLKTIQVLTILYLSIFSVKAQSKVNFIEGGISYYVPSGLFGQNNGNKVGFELAYLNQIRENNPFFWGISTHYTSLGSYNAIVSQVVDFYIYDFNSTTTTNLWGFNGKLRYYPDIYTGRFEVYFEALMGFNWIFTYTSKILESDPDNSSGQFDEGHIAVNYGAAAGIQYPAGKNFYINLKGGYYPGLSVPYYALSNKNTNLQTTLDAFELKRSTTDIMRFELGMTYRF